MAGSGFSRGSRATASPDPLLRHLLEDRALATAFQPVFGFGEGAILGYEALVRGPAGTALHEPARLPPRPEIRPGGHCKICDHGGH